MSSIQTIEFICYPFGMVMPTRSFEAGVGYKYGFNSKESDDETYGDGNVYDYGFRIYNPRLGKFLSFDPLADKFPMLTPFQFASNNPIINVDLDGREGEDFRCRQMEASNNGQSVEETRLGNDIEYSENDVEFIKGMGNFTFGIIGTIGSGAYILGTGGIGAGVGGSVGLMLSLGEVGIGFFQMIDAYRDDGYEVLHQSSSLPGMAAYSTNYEYSAYVDAVGAFVPGMITGGNINTLMKTPKTLREANTLGGLTFETLNSIDAGIDTWGVVDAVANSEQEPKTTFIPYKPGYIPAKKSNTHFIQKGETLGGIALKYNTDIETLARINNIKDVNKINAGDSIKTQ